jgi:hypothetical protein
VTPSITPSEAAPSAYILYSTDIDYQGNANDLLDYMLNNAPNLSWVGFNGGTGGYNSGDALAWMDWSGWAGTANGSGMLTTTVDQATYLFNQVTLASGTVSAGDTVYPAILIPTSSMSSDTYRLDDIGYDYTSNAGTSYLSLGSNTTVSGTALNYTTGINFPVGKYRVYYNVGLASNTNNVNTYYFKGLTKTP